MPLYHPQPARKSYFFAGGFTVMRYVFDELGKRTHHIASSWFRKSQEFFSKAKTSDVISKVWFFCVGSGLGLAGVFQYVTAFSVVFFCSLLHLFVIFVGLLVVSLAMLVISTCNVLFGLVYQIFFHCPNCYKHMPIPVFVCPQCSREHTRLWPSIYGVFYHLCDCGYRLPTLDWLGRKKLIRKCANPRCGVPLNNLIGQATNVHVPVVGGPSAGKSSFIVQATNQLIEYARSHEYSAQFPDANDKLDFEESLETMKQGGLVQKTVTELPKAYNLMIKSPGAMVGNILYFYDAAGEAFESLRHTHLHTFYQYVHGIVFVIDPFSMPNVLVEHAKEVALHRSQISPSRLDPEDVYTRIVNVMETSLGINNGRFPFSLAVILSKIDACGLEQRLGQEEAEKLLLSRSDFGHISDAKNELVRTFLIENKYDNLVRLMEIQFRNVRYFSCSALGRLPGISRGAAFVPQHVLEPLLWLLGTCKVLDTKN